MIVSVLFARPDSVYKTLPDCDVWDKERDALNWPTHVVQTRKRVNHRPHLPKAEREHTPLAFALWLCDLARRCAGKEVN